MARYLNDQNVVIGLHESGTYAGSIVGNPFWIGQVQSHDIVDSEGLIEQRFVGALDRNFQSMLQGPRDVTGTLVYNPQDMRLVFWSIGSTVNVSGTNATARVTEIENDVRQSPFTSGTLNPPISFALEDSKTTVGTGQNFIRRTRGIVPNITTVSASPGEKVEVTLEYVGQTLEYASGAYTSFVEIVRAPWLWNHTSITFGGSPVDTAKGVELIIDNGRTAPHYLNGSRDASVPFNGARNYTVNLTLDWEGTYSKRWYNDYFKGGSAFNMTIDFNADNAAGSQHAVFTLSGCRVNTATVPSPFEGVTESTVEIRPQSVTGSEFNAFLSGGLYGPY